MELYHKIKNKIKKHGSEFTSHVCRNCGKSIFLGNELEMREKEIPQSIITVKTMDSTLKASTVDRKYLGGKKN